MPSHIDTLKANGALGVLGMSQMQVVRATTRALLADDRLNRSLALNSIRDCREALAELEALLALPQDEAEAA